MFRWSGLRSGHAKVPALVIAGDIVTKAEATNHIVSIWREAKLYLVKGANHLTPFERPEEYSKAIADFARDAIETSREREQADVVPLAHHPPKSNGAPPTYLH
jgi:hypothetical protein